MVQYYLGLMQHVRLRIQVLRENPPQQRGASALEWAIISAIVVAIALGIAAVIKTVVDKRTDEIGNGG